MRTFLYFTVMLFQAASLGLAQPAIIQEPADQSASIGANVCFQVTASSQQPPLRYQWRWEGTDLIGKTNQSLTLNNVQTQDAGGYDVIVSDSSSHFIASQVAALEVDSTFTKITIGPIVSSGGYSFGCAWGDYDNDGYPDLFVCNWGDGVSTTAQHDFLFHNRRDGTFDRVLTGPLVNANHYATGAAWGDYDNDGRLDLFVTSIIGDSSGVGYNSLFHNEGQSRFTKVAAGSLVTQKQRSHSAIWADFDHDGLLDIFIANWGISKSTQALPNLLYHNRGNGAFDAVSFGPKALLNGDSSDVAAADFNNDGWTDFFVPQGVAGAPENDLLYLNDQNGTFILQTNSIAFTNKAYSIACAWGDYNNDGLPDLFVTRIFGGHNSLYRNNGGGTFTLETNVAPVLDTGNSTGCSWADYDNDGWLDLFVANVGSIDPVTLASTAPGKNYLYHNNGDGTFTKIVVGSLVNDSAYSVGTAWADYDNDGFLDLFVSNGWITKNENDFLYHNNGNSNNWLNLKLIGTVSNRSAIGAKVRVKATIRGRSIWQLREISGGGGHGCQNDLRASFGLGDATNMDLIRIEWPSGIVQEMTNVPAKKFLTVIEHQNLPAAQPEFTGATHVTNTIMNISANSGAPLRYLCEASTDLSNWTWLAARTNLTGTFEFVDPSREFSQRFYRVSAP